MITASCKFHDHDLTDIPVLNPVAGSGRLAPGTWRLIHAALPRRRSRHYLRRDRRTERQRDLRASAPRARRRPRRLPEDSRYYDGNGRVLDLDHLMVHGEERKDVPFPVKYHGDGLPAEGIDPQKYQ